MRMSSRAAIPRNIETQITPEAGPSNGGAVSAHFSGYLSRNPVEAGTNSADVSGVQASAHAPGTANAPQALGPSTGGFVSDQFNSFLGRNPGDHQTGPSTLDYDAFGWHEGHGLGGSSLPDIEFRGAVALPAEDSPIARPASALADAPHIDVLPAVQVFATDWLWH
jgi:hypothetical protein